MDAQSLTPQSASPLSQLISHLPLNELGSSLQAGKVVTAPLSAASIAIAVSAGAEESQSKLVVVLTANNGEEIFEELKQLLPQKRIFRFPHWETLPHERLSPQSDTIAERFVALKAIRDQVCDLIVVPVRSLLQPFIKDFGSTKVPLFKAGEQVELQEAVLNLLALGYQRTDIVEKRGEFAQRGGILDLFPPQAQHPIRAEFFDDVIDEVRYFSVADQRSLENCHDGLFAFPAREILITEEIKKRAAELAVEIPTLADLFNRISEGVPVDGMESLMPALIHEMENLIDILPKKSLLISVGPELIRSRADELIRTGEEFLNASWLNAADRKSVV